METDFLKTLKKGFFSGEGVLLNRKGRAKKRRGTVPTESLGYDTPTPNSDAHANSVSALLDPPVSQLS
jgi:hypothetical protein